MDWSKLKINAIITLSLAIGLVASTSILILLFDNVFFNDSDFWRLTMLCVGLVFPLCFVNIIFTGIIDVHSESTQTKKQWFDDNLMAIATSVILSESLIIILILLKYILNASINTELIIAFAFETFLAIISFIIRNVRLKRINSSLKCRLPIFSTDQK